MAGYTGSIADAGRLIHIAKRRERHKEDIEKQKRQIQRETTGSVSDIGNKFKTHFDAVEQTLKDNTVGLVTLDEMKSKQEVMIKERERQLAHKQIEEEANQRNHKGKYDETRNLKHALLSFDVDEDEESDDEEPASKDENPESVIIFKKRRIGKDPTVDTSFLPDKEREDEENRMREQLRQEWAEKQEQIKNETITIAFSYWDGSGHRRDLSMKKGQTIEHFLMKALEVLRKDFNELKAASADGLMFVKEDLIIPHFYTFYDFIVSKAMGKTGPLFEFSAAGELRIRQDAKTEMNAVESHPAKVVLRSWFEKNKHIYPASRWEPFDAHKKYVAASGM